MFRWITVRNRRASPVCIRVHEGILRVLESEASKRFLSRNLVLCHARAILGRLDRITYRAEDLEMLAERLRELDVQRFATKHFLRWVFLGTPRLTIKQVQRRIRNINRTGGVQMFLDDQPRIVGVPTSFDLLVPSSWNLSQYRRELRTSSKE